ncbi:MAG: phosphate ABC transporter permease PstA [Candidatus Eisenbacteria bacterium]|nr:phosphate ABC transporter permease PstA [Candidatus Eisenbacteria bacterium]
MNWRRFNEKLGFGVLAACMLTVVFFLVVIFYDLVSKGGSSVSWSFLSQMPRNGMTEGGILPAIVGTFLVTVITAVLAIPLGMGCAIYLNEYASDNQATRIIRMAIRNLSGVPSIVYGLFGVVLFVQFLHLGTSVLASGLTLGLMTLPWTITASEEALKTVPNAYREGALALGATKWQAIKTNVLPYAVPGMLTGTILGLARAAGETAPILFTGAAFFLPFLPGSPLDQFMALPYHLYIMSTQHQAITEVRPIAYGTALVLVVLVFAMNLTAIILRYRLRGVRSE